MERGDATRRAATPDGPAADSRACVALGELLRVSRPRLMGDLLRSFLQWIRDDAGLGSDEVASELPEIRSLNNRHDTFDRMRRAPSRDRILGCRIGQGQSGAIWQATAELGHR